MLIFLFSTKYLAGTSLKVIFYQDETKYELFLYCFLDKRLYEIRSSISMLIERVLRIYILSD